MKSFCVHLAFSFAVVGAIQLGFMKLNPMGIIVTFWIFGVCWEAFIQNLVRGLLGLSQWSTRPSIWGTLGFPVGAGLAALLI